LRLEERKSWGQSTLIPTPPATPQIGVRVLYYFKHQNIVIPLPPVPLNQ